MKTPIDNMAVIWKFVRGELPAVQFESWVYAEPDLEGQLGGELYLGTISTDFSDAEAVWELRRALAVYARAQSPAACTCVRLRDLEVVDMGAFRAPEPAFESDRDWSHDDVFRTLDEVKRRGPPQWWLWAARCRVCGQGWLVGQEERQNDLFCMRRLDAEVLQAIVSDGRWPLEFDSYEALLRVGSWAGRSVRFMDPLTSSMSSTISDLARARPGIPVSEIASLLALDAELAAELARKAVREEGVQITFDAG